MIKKMKNYFNDSNLKNVTKNSGILFSGDVVTSLFGLIALSITTLALSPEEFGTFVLIQAYILTIDQLLNFQSWQGLIKYGAESLEKKDYDELKGLMKVGTSFDLTSAILGFVVSISFASLIGKWQHWNSETIKIVIISSVVILSNLSGTPIGILRLFNKFKLFTIQQIICSILNLVFVVVAYKLGAGLFEFVGIWITTSVLGNIILLFMGYKVLNKNRMKKWWKSNIANCKPFLSFSIWTNLTSTLDIPIKQLDVFIISSVISIEGVAVYKVFKQVSTIISRIADPIYKSVFPQFAFMIANNQEVKAYKMAAKIGMLIVLVVSPIVLIVSLTSPWWLNYFFGELYASEWKILMIYLVFRAISAGFTAIHPLFVAMGYVQKNIVILLVANTIYVVSAWYLGSNIGLLGFTIAYFLQFSAVIIMKILYMYSKSFEKYNINYKSIKF